MKKTRQVFVLCVMLFTLLIVSTDFAVGEEWKQQDFIDLWKKVRTAVVEKNLEEFKKLIISDDPEETAKMTQTDFEEVVEYFLLDSFPAWETVKLLRFEQNDKKALLVLHLHDNNEEWKEWIAISAYTFILTDDGWKLSPSTYETSFSKYESAEENQKNIEEKLKDDPELRLGAE